MNVLFWIKYFEIVLFITFNCGVSTMSDEKVPSYEEVQQKAYDALKSYRDEWAQIDVDKLVNDGVLKPVHGDYEVLDHKRLPEVAKSI